jgi:hypothetical protein
MTDRSQCPEFWLGFEVYPTFAGEKSWPAWRNKPPRKKLCAKGAEVVYAEDGETATTNKSWPAFQVRIVVTERYSQEKTIRSCHYWSFQKRLLRIRGHA